MIADEFNARFDPRDGEAIAEAVRRMLVLRGFTLYRVAAVSHARYPHQAAYLVRRNFYSQLRSGLSPTLQQVLALAEVTDSQVWDWLRIFGFSLGDIPRLQAALARPQTTLIDDDLVDPGSLFPFLRNRQPKASFQGPAPLSQLLERSGSYRTRDIVAPAHGDFIYAKIGTEDALAFPDLLPGSIVRADPALVTTSLPRDPTRRSRNLFLVEHGRGLNCGRVRTTAVNRIAFVTDNPPLANAQFRLGTEARILGVVDFELRFASARESRRTAVAQVSLDLAKPRNPMRVMTSLGRHPGGFLRTARLRAGLSFRAASELSRWVAEYLGDDRYFTSPGTLSDYEAAAKLPRHIHKLFTLAILHGIRFRDFLRNFGITLDDSDGMKQTGRVENEPSGGFFEWIRQEFGDLPLFLAGALPALSGLAQISLRDVFWLGRNSVAIHPSLRGARFVLVNRRNKKPQRIPRTPTWSQPLYLLQERGGSYLAGSCAIENDRLVLYAYSQGSTEAQPARRYVDADVIGQIVGIARTLVSPP